MKKGTSLFILLLTVVTAYCQDGRDSFSIPWPSKYHWEIYNKDTGLKLTDIKKIENYNWVDFELIPETETLDNWTIACCISRYTRLKDDSSIKNQKISEVKIKSPKAIITVVEQHSHWSLFKIESMVSPNDTIPESELCYIRRGAWGNVYVADILVRKKRLDDDFITSWTKILESSEYRYW